MVLNSSLLPTITSIVMTLFSIASTRTYIENNNNTVQHEMPEHTTITNNNNNNINQTKIVAKRKT